MRDGLQSLNKVYNLQTKLKFMKLLSECNFHCVEFGSTTSPKLLPQMANSYELFKSFKSLEPKTQTLHPQNFHPQNFHTMLVPAYNHTQKVIDSGINSFGLVCSASDTFAKKNLNKTSYQTVENVSTQIDLITEKCPNPHIRVYISCAFGSNWEVFNSEYLTNLENYITEFLELGKRKKLSADNFDIVISDTVGLSTLPRTEQILKMLWLSVNKCDVDYLAMHIHSKDNKFLDVVGKCIYHDITKFDSSIGGIGGCPFAEDDAYGNISTVELIQFLSVHTGYYGNPMIEKIRDVERQIKELMNDEKNFYNL